MLKLFSWLKAPASNSGLSKAEVDLIGLLRLSPMEPLSGSELTLAQGLVSRGLMRMAGTRRYLVTEKGMVEFRRTRR